MSKTSYNYEKQLRDEIKDLEVKLKFAEQERNKTLSMESITKVNDIRQTIAAKKDRLEYLYSPRPIMHDHSLYGKA